MGNEVQCWLVGCRLLSNQKLLKRWAVPFKTGAEVLQLSNKSDENLQYAFDHCVDELDEMEIVLLPALPSNEKIPGKPRDVWRWRKQLTPGSLHQVDWFQKKNKKNIGK